MMTTFHALRFATPLLFAASLAAQQPVCIGFENFPAGSATPHGDRATVTDQYDVSPWFVRFSLPGSPGVDPMLAEVGGTMDAYQGVSGTGCGASNPTVADMPVPGQGLGCFALTDDSDLTNARQLLITFHVPCDQVSIDLIDIDGIEEWRVVAVRADGATAVTGGVQTVAAGDPGTGSGVATTISFNPGEPIHYLSIEQIANTPTAGFALDNLCFSVGGPSAAYVNYGNGCDSSTGTTLTLGASAPPRVGQSMNIGLTGALDGTLGVLFFGAIDPSIPLGPIGAPTCRLLVVPFAQVDVVTSPGGNAVVPLTIANDASLVGIAFRNQFAVIDQNANALGVTLSDGGAARIGIQ